MTEKTNKTKGRKKREVVVPDTVKITAGKVDMSKKSKAGKGYICLLNETTQALARMKLNGTEWAIYLHMLALANGNKDSLCYPSTNTLVTTLGAERSHIIDCRQRLEKLGLITLVYAGGKKLGERKANVYRVNTPELINNHTDSVLDSLEGIRAIEKEREQEFKNKEIATVEAQYANVDWAKFL